MESPLSNLWLVAILPIVSIVCLGLNFLIRARGGRSIVINLKAFGVELNINSVSTDKTEAIAPVVVLQDRKVGQNDETTA